MSLINYYILRYPKKVSLFIHSLFKTFYYMNILEALTLKKDLKERIEDLESRLTNSVTVLKGRKPIEDPQSLMTQLEDSSKQLNDICCRIKMANAMAKNDKGLTLVELVVKRSIEEKNLEILRRVFREALYGDGEVYYCDRKPIL